MFITPSQPNLVAFYDVVKPKTRLLVILANNKDRDHVEGKLYVGKLCFREIHKMELEDNPGYKTTDTT